MKRGKDEKSGGGWLVFRRYKEFWFFLVEHDTKGLFLGYQEKQIGVGFLGNSHSYCTHLFFVHVSTIHSLKPSLFVGL